MKLAIIMSECLQVSISSSCFTHKLSTCILIQTSAHTYWMAVRIARRNDSLGAAHPLSQDLLPNELLRILNLALLRLAVSVISLPPVYPSFSTSAQ